MANFYVKQFIEMWCIMVLNVEFINKFERKKIKFAYICKITVKSGSVLHFYV